MGNEQDPTINKIKAEPAIRQVLLKASMDTTRLLGTGSLRIKSDGDMSPRIFALNLTGGFWLPISLTPGDWLISKVGEWQGDAPELWVPEG